MSYVPSISRLRITKSSRKIEVHYDHLYIYYTCIFCQPLVSLFIMAYKTCAFPYHYDSPGCPFISVAIISPWSSVIYHHHSTRYGYNWRGGVSKRGPPDFTPRLTVKLSPSTGPSSIAVYTGQWLAPCLYSIIEHTRSYISSIMGPEGHFISTKHCLRISWSRRIHYSTSVMTLTLRYRRWDRV